MGGQGEGDRPRRQAERNSTPTIERPAPMVGERTEEILHEFGVDKKTIADLETRKVIEQATGLTAR